ncbi:MAG: protein kinase [Cyanobacteria bacterium J06642_2]
MAGACGLGNLTVVSLVQARSGRDVANLDRALDAATVPYLMQTCYCINPDCKQPYNPHDAFTCQTCEHPLLIRNRYRPYKKLGQGGFGVTFLARDQDLPSKPWRVIKQLRVIGASPQTAKLSQELFAREAEVLEALGQHSQIPTLYAHFEEGGHFYLVQEFVLGPTLSRELKRHGPMSEEQVRKVLREVAVVLSYVHSNNTVHRDIKPANLIRRKEDQRLVLIDFGAVKQTKLEGMEVSSAITAIRSLGYSPPEQMSGQAIEPASDLYALGATCLNLLTRQLPTKFFDHKHNCWTWREQLELSDEFIDILTKLLEPALVDRFASATEVLRSLQEASGGGMVQALSARAYRPLTSPQSTISKNWSSRRTELGESPSDTGNPDTGSGRSTTKIGSVPRRKAAIIAPTGTSATSTSKPKSMIGADLRDRGLANENFVGRDLRRADLRGADLTRANLRDADLRGVVYSTPKPAWQRVARRLLKLGGGLLGIAIALFVFVTVVGAAAGITYWLANRFLPQFTLALAGLVGLGACFAVGRKAWQLSERGFDLFRAPVSRSQRFTNLRETQLSGAKMEEDFRRYARSQGALLD